MMRKNKNAVFALLIPLLMLVYICFGGSVGISLDFGETALTVSAQDLDWSIPYDRISSLELTDQADYGTLLAGSETRKLHCGTYENERWGRYTLCIDPRIDKCIVIGLADGFFVLNYETAESTEQLHTMFTQLLAAGEFLSTGPAA